MLIDDETGSVLSGGTDNPPGNTGKDWAKLYNTVQHYAIDHSRLHIPIVYGVDAVHGFGHPTDATLFPQSIGMGATWDTKLARQAGAATATQLCATARSGTSPPSRTPRATTAGAATTRPGARSRRCRARSARPTSRGMQRPVLVEGRAWPRPSSTSPATRSRSTVTTGSRSELPIRYLQDQFLPSYAAGINAGADTVMVNSGSINGIPATASHFLLTTELRQRLGFKGVVISDYDDVSALQIDLPHRSRPRAARWPKRSTPAWTWR